MSYFHYTDVGAPTTKPKAPFNLGTFLTKVMSGLFWEVTVAGLGVAAAVMLALSMTAFTEAVVMGFQLAQWHAFPLAAGFVFFAFLLGVSDVKTPLALIARISVLLLSGAIRTFLPFILLMAGILWLIGLPGEGVISPALGVAVWFSMLTLPSFFTAAEI